MRKGFQLRDEPSESPAGSELCPAPVWQTAGVGVAACVTILCDCMWLGRSTADTYPYRSLKFIYVFIGELVPKHDGLSCLPSLLWKRYQGQLKANCWCITCGWSWAVSCKLSSKAVAIATQLPRSCSVEVCVWTNTACCHCGRGWQG